MTSSRMLVTTRPSSRSAIKLTVTNWRLSGETIITRAGTRVHDMKWHMRDEHPLLNIVDWDCPVAIDGVEVGRLSDPENLPLVQVFQTAVAVRWLYRTPEDGKPWNALRAAGAAAACRAFAAWLVSQGIRQPAAITEEVFLAYLDLTSLTNAGTVRTTRDRRVLGDPALLIHRLRHRLGCTLGFVPQSADILSYVTGPEINEPIALVPKPVLDHVLAEAINYITIYSKDILAARPYLEQLATQWEKLFGRRKPRFRRGSREYRAFDTWLGNRFGFRTKQARRAMGSCAPWNEDGRFLPDGDGGAPWLEHIRTRQHLKQLENSLRTACFILLAFLMGGRSIEVLELETDCVITLKGNGGSPDQHFINGKLRKHRGRNGERANWSVHELAVEAVAS